MRKLERQVNEARFGTQPRDMTDADYAEWDSALDNRDVRPQTREAVRKALRRMNPVRYRQLQGDINWAKRCMKRMGLNPEDWRYIL